ncbi:MAG: DMT family transporter [Deltaproteobacteria bacterium]|nr:DMT family transporter [Deltaproteobacteria bacterium]
MGRPQERAGLVFAALCALNGAFVPAVAKLTTGAADGLFVAAATSVFAGLAALVLLAARGELGRLFARARLPYLLAIGALGTAVTFLLFYEGARRTSAILTALCLQIEPVYSLLLARVALGHPLTPRRIGAVAVILAGIALALSPAGGDGWLGVTLLLATPLGWQLSHLIVLRGLGDVAPLNLTGARYLFGGVILAAVWAVSGGVARLPVGDALARLVPVLALQGIVLSFVGTLLWYATIARLDLARATSIVVPSIPLLSLGASFLLLGEVAGPREWAGLALTAAGVLAFVTAPDAHEPRVRVPSPTAPIVVADPE